MERQWDARMIGPIEDVGGAPLLRGEFDLEAGHGEVVEAVLHVTARGVVTARINGGIVGEDVLAPGWSSYEWRLRYRSHDVTARLREHIGPVVLGLELGNGWWRGRLGWDGHRALYGSELGGFMQLEVRFADGHQRVVGTDRSWRAGPSAVLANDLYDGQTIDARSRDDSWHRPGFVGGGWVGVRVQDLDTAILTPYVGPPVRRQEELRPVRVWTSPSGRTLVDFGQNLVGWIRCTVRGERGTTVTLRHAEVLEDGELGVRPLRTAAATDRFVLSGGDDVFEPTLTFHGFRYAEVEGWPGELTAEEAGDALVAVVVHSELPRTGYFACSDESVNRLHANVVWGMRGNFLDVPTDCPQRDERLGWTGDIAVFAPTAAFLFDVGDFLRDWLADLAAEQRAGDGLVPFVVPDVLRRTGYPPDFPAPQSTAIWGDAAVWVPWALWWAYGDERILTAAYPSMAAHIRRVETLLSNTGLWDTGFQFGDWLDPTAPPDEPFKAKADSGVVATACLHRSARTTAEAARLLGRDEDAEHFDALADRTRAAFVEHYVAEDGMVRSDCPTVYALAICFDLLDDERERLGGDRLAVLVAENDFRIATGFAGTPYVTDALTRTGHLDTAYRLLLQRECPSWLYPVSMGATTLWERWDSMLPDGRINPGQMTSFNHYALGAVADWLHRVVGGIAPVEPGYRTVRIAPRPGGALTWAEASLDSPHGQISVRWETDPVGRLDVDLLVPDGVIAEIDLPGSPAHRVAGGRHRLVGYLACSRPAV